MFVFSWNLKIFIVYHVSLQNNILISHFLIPHTLAKSSLYNIGILDKIHAFGTAVQLLRFHFTEFEDQPG